MSDVAADATGPAPVGPGERTADAAAVSVTWVGHATALIDVGGYRIVTDPALTRRLGHLVRRVPVPDIGPVDAVLVSHLHLDHLHRPSLQQVAGGARVLVPRGARRLLRRVRSEQVDEIGPGDRVHVAADTGRSGLAIEAVPARHSGRRGPHSRVAAPAVGYVVRAGATSVYFAGDTDLFDEMAGIGPVSVALLPIWGWGPTLGEHHLDPARAAQATEIVAPDRVVPIHWGTYSPVRARRGPPAWLGRPLDAFRRELRARDLHDRLVGLAPGGSVAVAADTPTRTAAAAEDPGERDGGDGSRTAPPWRRDAGRGW